MSNSQNDEKLALEIATRWNRSLAKRVARWKRTRLAAAVVLSAIGVVLLLIPNWAVLAAPCFVAAIIAYVLYLDARDQLRVVRARRWGTITPRLGPSADKPPRQKSDAPVAP